VPAHYFSRIDLFAVPPTDFAHDAFPNEARLVCFSSGCRPQGGRWWRMGAQAAVAGAAAVLMVTV